MIAALLVTELAKLRRSIVPWVTLGTMLCALLGVALLIWVAGHPQRASQLGLLGTKANLAGLEASWSAYGLYLSVIAGAAGTLVLAFVVAYLFGREYADETAKNMLTLPVPRGWFVAGKLAVAALWWAALVVATLLVGLALGSVMGLSGGNAQVVGRTVGTTVVTAVAAFMLVPVYAWVTIATRHYLATTGFAVGMLLLGNLLGHTGWGLWFPWSIVPLLTGMSGESVATLPWGSWLVLVATFGLGTVGSVAQLTRADNP